MSCAAREAEWRKGRNAKGKPPVTYRPLHDVGITIQHADGRIERRLVQALHQVEAIGRVLRDLPEGARFVDERRLTAWNASTREFEQVCTHCGTQGLTLERTHRGVLERHCWACQGEPQGSGWHIAPVRMPLLALDVETAAAWLNTDPEPGSPGAWRATAHPCKACGVGQIEGLLTAPGGRWRTRCGACCATSAGGSD